MLFDLLLNAVLIVVTPAEFVQLNITSILLSSKALTVYIGYELVYCV